jgi:hypothetical protein
MQRHSNRGKLIQDCSTLICGVNMAGLNIYVNTKKRKAAFG